MARITRARGRIVPFVAFALVGLAACHDALPAEDGRGDGFETLSRKVAASKARPTSNHPDAFELLARKVAAANVRPTTGGLVLVPPGPAPSRDGRAAQFGTNEDSAWMAAHEIGMSPPPSTAAPLLRLVVPKSAAEWFNPRGGHEGTEGIVTDLAKLGVTDNAPLYVNECWGRGWGAATSDHHRSQARSWACDLSVAGIQVPTAQAQEAARRIGSALGEPGWTGGNLRKTINGYRIQVLWKVAGHFNHVHIGARKL